MLGAATLCSAGLDCDSEKSQQRRGRHSDLAADAGRLRGALQMALVADVAEVLVRHGYPPPVGVALVNLTAGLYRTVHHHPCS